MPLLVYFKNPPMSLLLKGNINKDYVRRLRKAFGGVVEMQKPDDQPIVLIGKADCDLSYIAEITQGEMDDMMKKSAADRARNLGDKKITPASSIPGRRFTGKGN